MKQARALTITDGRLVTPGGIVSGAIRCANGRIEAVGEVAARERDEIVDAKGLLVAPGLVDFGVFAIDKPAFHFGGITRAALMPDQSPPLDHPARVRFAAQSGKPDFWVHPLGAATIGLEGTHLGEIALMVIAGGVSITASLKPCWRRIARSLARRATVVCAKAGYSASRSFHQSASEPCGSMSISTTGPAPARCA